MSRKRMLGQLVLAMAGVFLASQSFSVAPAPLAAAVRGAGIVAAPGGMDTHDGLPVGPPAQYAPIPLSFELTAPLRQHELFGFAPYWTLGSQAGYDLRDLTTVAYFGVDVSADGSLVQSGSGWQGYRSQALVDLIDRAHSAGTRVVLTAKTFDGATIHALSSSPGAADRLASQLTAAIGQKHMDGANLDFEGLGGTDRFGFARFVTRTSQLLHEADPHWQVTADTYASSALDPTGFFDVPALASAVDGLFVMAYDMNHTSNPSPVAPLTGTAWNVTRAVSSYVAVAPPSKVLLGVPFYGYDWPTSSGSFGAAATGPRSAVGYGQVAAARRPEYWDASAQVPWTAYQDGSGHWHQVYYDDPASLALKAAVADRQGLGGLGIWALGMDGNDPSMIAALLGKSVPLKASPGQIGQPPSVPGSLAAPPPTPQPTPAPPTPSPSPSGSPTPSPSPSATPSPSPSPSLSPSPLPPPPSPSPSPSASASASPTPSPSTSPSPTPSPSASP
jgi:spore germination protein YaaH